MGSPMGAARPRTVVEGLNWPTTGDSAEREHDVPLEQLWKLVGRGSATSRIHVGMGESRATTRTLCGSTVEDPPALFIPLEPPEA